MAALATAVNEASLLQLRDQFSYLTGHVAAIPLCRITLPFSCAPLAVRPLQRMVGRHLRSEARTTTATGVPKGENNNNPRPRVVVDVVPDP